MQRRGGEGVWAPGLRAFLSCRPPPTALPGDSQDNSPAGGSPPPPPGRAPGPAPPPGGTVPPAHMRSPGPAHDGDGGRPPGWGRRLPLSPEKQQGCSPPPRGVWVRGWAHSTARPCGEGKGRTGQGCDRTVTDEAPAACAGAGGSQRVLTFVDILRLARLPGCHPHHASKAPVFPSTLSSAAKKHINLL